MKNKKNRINYINQYNADNYDRVNLSVPKGVRAEWKKIAEKQGLSLVGLVTKLMDNFIRSVKQGPLK